MKKIAVVSSSNNHTYSFFAPIVASLWQRRIGYECLIIQSEPPDVKTKFSLEFAQKHFGARIKILQNKHKINPTTLSQVSRLFASYFVADDDAYILSSDIDMLPISHAYFNNISNIDEKIYLYFYNAYDMHKFPICYIGAAKNIWNDVISIDGVDVEDAIAEDLKIFLSNNPTDLQIWNYDELYFEKKLWSHIERQKLHDSQIIKIYRNVHQDRIDRSDWRYNHDFSKIVDCHALRPMYELHNFNRVIELLQNLLDTSSLQKLREYYDIYKYL
jgi:hypothetical protein